MTTTVQHNPNIESEKSVGRTIFGQFWRTSPVLTIASIAYVVLTLVLLILLPLDSRTVLNEAVWIKPIKFAISTAIYTTSIVWLLSYIERPRWLVKTLAGLTAFALTIEMGAIIVQAGRGVRSHYNQATPFDEILWGSMGAMIMLLWVTNFVILGILLFKRLDNRPFKWALVSGLVIAILGGLLGFHMTEQTTPAQQTVIDAGGRPEQAGGHTFGAEDGGAGLPFVGWSTTHGDLRPAHFFGLHGLQVIPLLGFFINRRWGQRFGEGRRTLLVLIGAGAYLMLIYALYQQALRGISIVTFDLQTVAILSTTALIAAVAAWATVWRGNRQFSSH